MTPTATMRGEPLRLALRAGSHDKRSNEHSQHAAPFRGATRLERTQHGGPHVFLEFPGDAFVIYLSFEF